MDADVAQPVPQVVRRALAAVAADRGFPRPRFHVESGSNVGDGYMSALYRAVVENEDGAPSTDGQTQLRVMCKTMMPSTRGSILVEHIFKIEDVMYASVLPGMEAVARFEDPLPWPRGYSSLAAGRDADVDADPGAWSPPCLVMEDLRPAGFVMPTRGTVLDEAHCRLVLAQLARYHAAGMALARLQPDHFRRLRQQMGDPFLVDAIKENYKAFLRVGETVPDLVTDRYPEGSPTHDKLKELCSNFTVDFFTAEAPDPLGGNTIMHGDCHMKNFMWQYDKASGAVTACRLIDFQAARYGYPAPDLVVLLLSGTEKALRDQHWDSLLRGYHAELQRTLRAAGCEDPDAVYSWGRLQAQLRRAAVIGMCFAPLLIHGFNDRDALKDVQDTVAQMTAVGAGTPRRGEAGEGETGRRLAVPATPLLRRRVGDVVQSLLEWGWL